MSAAEIDECEAYLTPDTCRLRGTCDHYDASKLRIAGRATPRDELHELRERCEQQAAEIARLLALIREAQDCIYKLSDGPARADWGGMLDRIDAALAEQKEGPV